MDYRIDYSSNSVSDGFSTTLTISSSASPLLMVGSNADRPGPDAVGAFSAAPARVPTQAFVQAAQRLVQSRSLKPAPVLPGQVVRRVTVWSSSGAEQERYATETSPADPEFSTAEAAALALAQLLRQHPKAALSGRSVFRRVDPEGFDVTVDLVNVGSDSLTIPHPGAWGAGAASLTVTALRNDVPLAELRNEHQRFIRLTGAQLSSAKPPLGDGQPILFLPNHHVTLTFAMVLPLPKGSYDLWTTFEAPILDANQTPIVRVELVSAREQWRAP